MRAASGSMRPSPACAERHASSEWPKADAEVAHHGRVREVALPARNRELVREVAQHRVREAGVALGVLERDRVHLVRHRRGADFAGDDILREVAEGDVAPGVAAQVDQHGVRARDGIAVFRDPVVRLDLRRVLVRHEAEPGDERARLRAPVHRGERRKVGVEVADRPVELAEDLDAAEAGSGTPQARREVRGLLAERGRRRRLAVRPREHRQRGVPRGERRHRVADRADRRQQDALAGFRQHQRVCEVIDVLRRARRSARTRAAAVSRRPL